MHGWMRGGRNYHPPTLPAARPPIIWRTLVRVLVRGYKDAEKEMSLFSFIFYIDVKTI